MKEFVVALCLLMALMLSGTAAWAQEEPNWAPYPDLTEVWTGK